MNFSALKNSVLSDYDHATIIIDDLCTAVRNGSPVSDLIEMLRQLDIYEKSHGHTSECCKIHICINSASVVIDLNMLGSDGFNVLHVACGSANMKVMEYLIKKRKLNPNKRAKDDWRPLEILVQNGLTEGVEFMLSHAKPNLSKISSRGSVLHTAVRNKNFKICQILLLAERSLVNAVSPSG